jgi:hypothetical protein
MRALAILSLALLPLAVGCTSQTVLLATFENDSVGAAPSQNQQTGTVAIEDGAGSVRVVAAPPGASSNWVQINHPTAQTNPTALQGNFSQFKGDGTYGLLAVCFLPKGTGVVTLQFEPFGQPVTTFTNFLHLDFLPNNTVRINDTDAVFGTFPRDQFFTISVTLTITASAATAHMQLLGAGASGDLDVDVKPLALARQFGAIRFWMGFQHAGSFLVDEIVVTHKNP